MLSLRGKKRVSLRGGTGGGGDWSIIGSLGRDQRCAAEAFKSHFATLFKKKDDVHRI